MSSSEVQSLRLQLEQLQQQNIQLRAQLAEHTCAEPAESAQALTDTQQRYRFLFDAMDEGFCIIEFFDGPHGPLSDYIHVEANAAYAKHAGIDNVVGQKLREMVPDEANGWLARYGAVLHSGEPIRFDQELVATGRHLDVCAFRMEPASRKQVAVLFQDVTARKRAEAALKHLNEELEERVAQAVAERRVLTDVVEATLAQIQVVGLDMRWLAINSAAREGFTRVFGLTPSVGDSMPEAMAQCPDDCARGLQLWTRALKGEAFAEVAEFGQGDQHRHFELRFSPLHDQHGQLIGAYLFAYDISERVQEQKRLRKTEEALRQSQKMEAVGQLTGGIAHDFNNLLTGILGSLELSRKLLGRGLHQEVDAYLHTAQDTCNRAAALIHRLLAFSRRQTLEPRTIDVNRLVSGMIELIRRSVGPHIDIELFTASAPCRASIDPSQLENALLNLCINARDALSAGGRINIETRHLQADEQVATHLDLTPGDYLMLSVSDNGSGMPPHVLARALEPFYTTKPVGQGTGLGLPMVYGFVRQSGGQVRVYSEPGQGTSVHLYLPRLEAASMPSSEPLARVPKQRELRDITVMLVDDEATIRMLVGEVLSDLGYERIEFADGHSALAALHKGVSIDLLISDVGMPGGMNGQQLVAAARKLRPRLKVLFITGYAEQAVLGNGVFEPTTRVLTKPFSLDSLARRIEEMIG
ncbi:hybrid sensor histidine kinase/response regulator [Pseudomonas rubra]|uniref:histidine kinase n=1 Tax=Pseudomonas rubra TaxID=2942627 RepID=A0ABT5P1X7_9PSED|nr:PAS domain-containing protein [Pseudomonas rubra]MDD1012108.1 PAS domain-containing protein [Pseudomonas rubra]MDD1038456.1 PAS domain-containing protein [Pseudomonas rubra]MDD1153493.1 PAS domain-containing protein [Pseudomonas rubra]